MDVTVNYEWYRRLMLSLPPRMRKEVKRAFQVALEQAETEDYHEAFVAMAREFLGTYNQPEARRASR